MVVSFFNFWKLFIICPNMVRGNETMLNSSITRDRVERASAHAVDMAHLAELVPLSPTPRTGKLQVRSILLDWPNLCTTSLLEGFSHAIS